MARPVRCVGSGVMHDIVRVYKTALAWGCLTMPGTEGSRCCYLLAFRVGVLFLLCISFSFWHLCPEWDSSCQQFMLEIWSCLNRILCSFTGWRQLVCITQKFEVMMFALSSFDCKLISSVPH